jgi:hypothetical protein
MRAGIAARSRFGCELRNKASSRWADSEGSCELATGAQPDWKHPEAQYNSIESESDRFYQRVECLKGMVKPS